MIRSVMTALLLVAFTAAGSAVQGAERASGRGPGVSAPSIGKAFQPSWAPISSAARIFLVAGGRDSANFAQEIIDQKKFWLAQGYKPDHIECFYAVPPARQMDDAEQFLSLEEGLRDCHLAAPDIIYAAIVQVASEYQQDFFYLYVSSHGTDPPRMQLLPPQVFNDPGLGWYVRARAEAQANPQSEAWQWFSPFRMDIEGIGDTQGWDWTSFSSRYLRATRNPGTKAEDNLFTPKYLARALQKFPASVKKIVVLQACHSGGFLLPPDEAPAPDETLVTVPNITVLTAASAERTSFGCDTSDHTTYYGGALQEVLDASRKENVPARDWRAVHEAVSAKVDLLETQQDIPPDQRSLPQFFSNMGRK
jgi:hypothetical protein